MVRMDADVCIFLSAPEDKDETARLSRVINGLACDTYDVLVVLAIPDSWHPLMDSLGVLPEEILRKMAVAFEHSDGVFKMFSMLSELHKERKIRICAIDPTAEDYALSKEIEAIDLRMSRSLERLDQAKTGEEYLSAYINWLLAAAVRQDITGNAVLNETERILDRNCGSPVLLYTGALNAACLMSALPRGSAVLVRDIPEGSVVPEGDKISEETVLMHRAMSAALSPKHDIRTMLDLMLQVGTERMAEMAKNEVNAAASQKSKSPC